MASAPSTTPGRMQAKQRGLREVEALVADIATDEADPEAAIAELKAGVDTYERAVVNKKQWAGQVADLRKFAKAARTAADMFPVLSSELLSAFGKAFEQAENGNMPHTRAVRFSSRHLAVIRELRKLSAAAEFTAKTFHLRPPDYDLNYLAYVVARVMRIRLGKEPTSYVDGDYAKLLTATFTAAGLSITAPRRRMDEGLQLLDELEG